MPRNRATKSRITMDKFPFETDFHPITQPDHILNTFSWQLRNLITKSGKMKSYIDKDKTMLVEDYTMDDRAGVDNIWICVERMKKLYSFDYGFVQPSTMELSDTPHGFNMGKVIFYNIKEKKEKSCL